MSIKINILKRASIAAILLLGGMAPLSLAGASKGAKFSEFRDNFDSKENFSKNWTRLSDELPGDVDYVKDNDGNGYIRVTCDERTAQGVKHKLTGLTPGTLYRVSARVKTDSVAEGRGAVLYLNPNEEMGQPWNASKFIYGSTDWTSVYMDFVCEPDGTAEIALALGFPWGTYNGGTARGTVMWDDVQVTPTPAGAMKVSEGKHVRVLFDADKTDLSEEQMKPWVKELDKVYESYTKLVGGKPYEGRRLEIISSPGLEPGYWALAGNPILVNSQTKIGSIPSKYLSDKDWSFGVTHEIGHVFNASHMNKAANWNWNDELFANFRMSYAVDKLNGTVFQDRGYTGSDIINFYKKAYDRTLGADKPSCDGDALHYTLLRIKEKYGWKVFEKAFRTLYALGENDIDRKKPDYEKFRLFLDHVSSAAGEDVALTTYTPREMELIKQGFEK